MLYNAQDSNLRTLISFHTTSIMLYMLYGILMSFYVTHIVFDFSYIIQFHSVFAVIHSHVLRMARATSPNRSSRIMVFAEDGGVRLLSPTTSNIITTLFPLVNNEVTFFSSYLILIVCSTFHILDII